MNVDDIIKDLKDQIQRMEYLKATMTEAQEDLRETICQMQMSKEGETR